MVARQFQRALDGLGAGVAIKEAVRSGHRRDGRKALGQIGERLVEEIGAGDVDQFRGLLLNRRNDFGMAMAGRNDGDAGGKIEKLVAIHIFDADAAAALGHQRIRARITGRNEPGVGLDSRSGFGSGKGQLSFGPYCACSSCLVMNHLLGRFSCAAGRDPLSGWGAATDPCCGIVCSADPNGSEKAARIFGGRY